MDRKYDPIQIEAKWQKRWEEAGAFRAEDNSSKPKFYPLIEFPYPSGAGLHVGHPRPYTAMDIVARKRRLEGYNVLFTMGWDAFGLPTENYAIKNKIHPRKVTEDNIKRFKEQLQSLGLSFDWSREIDTTDPNYFKWTQWIFLQFFERGLAYKKSMTINWCPSCKVGLANEEVVQGCCERCKTQVVRKPKEQWMLKITDYAEKLLEGLDEVDFIERVKTQQRNWIGKSEGAEIDFELYDASGKRLEDREVCGEASAYYKLKIFTSRPDTIYGTTYMVISPEHPMIRQFADRIANMPALEEYAENAAKKSDFERAEMNKDKTGVKIEGIYAKNPISGAEMPIFISDYVLMTYGTGAIMAVPAHDERDHEFAKKFDLPIIRVIKNEVADGEFDAGEYGELINSPLINGLSPDKAKEKIVEELEKLGLGRKKINYKLRDWVFSRQRYWGEPMPLVYCEEHGWQGVPENELPVLLPDVENYEPTDNGESPLANMEDWIRTTCPVCGGPARRETDTMPQWAGSSWYYLRYTDTTNEKALADKALMDYWLPVDWYNGGMEHTTLHLLYSRFWHRFLYDIGVVGTKEPYMKRTSHGLILAEDSRKMSKSFGNVISPDKYTKGVFDEKTGEMLKQPIGADALRLFEMFIGDFEKPNPWSEDGVIGARRYLDKVWQLMEMTVDGEEYLPELETVMHQTIKKVSYDYENLKFNTAIAQLMTLMNEIRTYGTLTRRMLKDYLLLLNPVAPHITEEIWEIMNFGGELRNGTWPKYEEEKTVDSVFNMAISVNGKFKMTIPMASEIAKEEAIEKAKTEKKIAAALEGREIVKTIYVEKKMINFVIK